MTTIDNMLSYALADAAGNPVGFINSVHHDDRTGVPEWITVEHLSPAGRVSFVPAMGLVLDHEKKAVVTPYDHIAIVASPPCAVGERLSDDDERMLFEHYCLTYTAVIQDDGLSPTSVAVGPYELVDSSLTTTS
jgi:hypothetical protein